VCRLKRHADVPRRAASGRACRVPTMKKVPLYSRSQRAVEPPPEAAAGAPEAPAGSWRSRLVARLSRHERRLWAAALIVLAAAFWWLNPTLVPKAPLTFEQIDAAMRQSIEDKPLIAPESRAYDSILPSVVRVVGLMTDGDDGKDDKDHGTVERGIGSGVVIIDNGTILTNLHVINGAKKVMVTFFDGSESEAVVLKTQPENDLAVLRARTIPDDLEAATMRSTADLSLGDKVIAVGFPFGIGPSVSSGIVSGLKRQFRSPDGQQTLTNLIQFDAAANPGNSGGPLVTMDGEVVGIVTAILNPSRQRVFIGIGFAMPIENAAALAGMPPF
jgi:S1-C subfamily serine protease